MQWRELFFCQLSLINTVMCQALEVLDPSIIRLMVRLPPRTWDADSSQDNLEDKGGEVGPRENS